MSSGKRFRNSGIPSSSSSNNPFAALASTATTSDSDGSGCSLSNPEDVSDIAVAGAQSGGTVALRADSLLQPSSATAHPDCIPGLSFSSVELSSCIKVVSALGANPHFFKLPLLKPLRSALHPLIMHQITTNYAGEVKDGESKRQKPRRKAKAADPDERLKEMEKEFINQTQLRAARLQQLEALNEEGGGLEVPRVPDGVGAPLLMGGMAGGGLLMNAHTAAPSSLSLTTVTKDGASGVMVQGETRSVLNPLSCYICRKPYRELHFFYSHLCPDCALFNWSKRQETADLTGMYALVTGGRQKIGFQCCLKLLRCGAHLIVTTRFPVDAAKRFLREHDSARWRERLHVFGLDFRDINVLEQFCSFVAKFYPSLHIIINNACQTVRRPPAYYAALVEEEMLKWDSMNEDIRTVLQPYRLFLAALDAVHGQQQASFAAAQPSPASGEVLLEEVDGPSASASSAAAASSSSSSSSLSSSSSFDSLFASNLPLPSVLKASCMTNSALASQAVVIKGDEAHSTLMFPKGATDVNGQQVDLRRENSWMLRLHQVSTDEMAEVLTINTMAPAVINARLKVCMERNAKDWKFIVNVSAMEGKFYRYKSKNHPHTNMAKAALNMMTRTSAQDYVTSLIYMTAVDTGWINDEKPVELAVQHERMHNFQTPIDEVDAASRVLDPVISPLLQREQGVAGVTPPWGVFLKDYQKCEW